MESKKLPALWVSAPNLLEDMEAGHGNVIASLEPRGRKPSEPYIPVSRVREMIADTKRWYGRNCLIAESLEKLIADVEEG